MKVVTRDLWLCDDCTIVAANGDTSGIDSEKRIKEIEDGLEKLGPHLVLDHTDEQEYTCDDCHKYMTEKDLVKVDNPECEDCTDCFDPADEGKWNDKGCSLHRKVNGCPHCKSAELTKRESGTNEFSRDDCDCCGTRLAGSRTRFALLGPDEETPSSIV